MTECLHCHKPLPAARPGQRYCRTSCQSAAWAKRKRDAAKPPRPEPPEVEVSEVEETLAPAGLTAEAIRALVFEYHLPEPYTVCPTTGQPLWRFRELAELFSVTEFELRDVLVARGQPFLKVSIGTSAGILVRG